MNERKNIEKITFFMNLEKTYFAIKSSMKKIYVYSFFFPRIESFMLKLKKKIQN